MSAPRDPAWVVAAARFYDACLWLYPRALRDAHGDEMRQAFRDRCREVARGRRSGLQFAVELAPDLSGSATRAQLDAGRGNDARVIPGLLILVGLAVALATQPLWSGSAVNGMKAVESIWLMWREQREVSRADAVLQRLSGELVATKSPDAVATAALLQQARAEQERWYAGPLLGEPSWDANAQPHPLYFSEAAADASQLAGRVAAGHAQAPALAIAAQACTIRGGCKVDFVIGRLLAAEPRNALGWMLAFKRASQRGDDAAMQAALQGAAAADYYDSYKARVYALLQRQLAASGEVDAETSAILAEHVTRMRQVPTADWHNDLRSRCSFGNWPTPPTTRWLDERPRGVAVGLAATAAGPRPDHPRGRARDARRGLAATGGVEGWHPPRRAGPRLDALDRLRLGALECELGGGRWRPAFVATLAASPGPVRACAGRFRCVPGRLRPPSGNDGASLAAPCARRSCCSRPEKPA
jgi:hypothetical protein